MRRCSLDELNVIEGVRKAAKTGVVNGKGRLAHCTSVKGVGREDQHSVQIPSEKENL